MRLLVVGARPNSLGEAVAELAGGMDYGWDVVTAGLYSEYYHIDLVHNSQEELDEMVRKTKPDHVVCTAGINHGPEYYAGLGQWMSDHLQANVIGPMRLLDAWLRHLPDGELWYHYVAISSNSARIPRSRSTAYCASKAALSMALQVQARDVASDRKPVSVYGYEPGLLAFTPMTEEVSARIGGAAPLTRMRGIGVESGMSVFGLAGHIVRNIAFGGPELNGCLLRVDAGEI